MSYYNNHKNMEKIRVEKKIMKRNYSHFSNLFQIIFLKVKAKKILLLADARSRLHINNLNQKV